MKHFALCLICGICIAVMAGAAGIKSWSTEWWTFIVAGNVLVTILMTYKRN